MINKKDPVCGMEGNIQAHGHYFCSEECIRKYEKKNKIPPESCYVGAVPWYRERIYQVSLILALIFSVHFSLEYFGITLMRPFALAFYDYIKLIWWAILAGLLIGGFIDYFIPRKYISKHLAKSEKKTIFYAVGLGVLLSACSHGILAISMELHKKGVATPAVIALLLASPWANLPITILLFGFFGWKAALFIVFAILVAVITGIIYMFLESVDLVEKNENSIKVEEGFSVLENIKKRWNKYKFNFENIKKSTIGILHGAWNLAKMILWWILIGMAIASVARAYIPQDFFLVYMGASILGLLITLGIATALEVCSEGTAPLAFEVFKQTGAFGNSFVFLMAGVATDYTEIGLIWSNIGKRAAIWLPIITVPQVVLLGYLFNMLI